MGDWDPQTAAMGRSAIGARPQAARPLRNALEGQRGARERAAARPVETPSARRPQPQKPQPQPQPPKPPKPAAGPVAADPARVAVRERTVRHEPVSDSSLRELHQRLAEISKTAGRPTVSFEGLAKSLRATEAKLREKHGNRPIEFEIALKDGKPVVKPIVR